MSLSQEYATLNWVQLSVGTSLCPATTKFKKFQVGVAGTTFFRPCTRVKVRVTLNQCIRISTHDQKEAPTLSWNGLATLFLSLLLQFEFGLHRYHDSVWMPLDMYFCSSGTCFGLLCWWACTSRAKHNQAKFRIIWHNEGQKAYFLA